MGCMEGNKGVHEGLKNASIGSSLLSIRTYQWKVADFSTHRRGYIKGNLPL